MRKALANSQGRIMILVENQVHRDALIQLVQASKEPLVLANDKVYRAENYKNALENPRQIAIVYPPGSGKKQLFYQWFNTSRCSSGTVSSRPTNTAVA